MKTNLRGEIDINDLEAKIELAIESNLAPFWVNATADTSVLVRQSGALPY